MNTLPAEPAAVFARQQLGDAVGARRPDTTGSETRPGSSPIRSPLRWPTAAAVLVAGGVHVPPVPEHLHEAPYIGLLFIGLALACTGTAGLMAWHDTSATWRIAAILTGAAALAYLASRTVGLPEMGDDIGNWSDPLGTIAVITELSTVALAYIGLRRHRPDGQSPRRAAASDTVSENTPTLGKDDNS